MGKYIFELVRVYGLRSRVWVGFEFSFIFLVGCFCVVNIKYYCIGSFWGGKERRRV